MQPILLEEKTRGGILLPEEIKKREQQAVVKAKVLAIGPDCFADYSEPGCKVGDYILYQKYVGMKTPDDNGGFREDLLLINDTDVVAVVAEEDNG